MKPSESKTRDPRQAAKIQIASRQVTMLIITYSMYCVAAFFGGFFYTYQTSWGVVGGLSPLRCKSFHSFLIPHVSSGAEGRGVSTWEAKEGKYKRRLWGNPREGYAELGRSFNQTLSRTHCAGMTEVAERASLVFFRLCTSLLVASHRRRQRQQTLIFLGTPNGTV